MDELAKQKNGKRIAYVDAMKGILIILMVCGHCFWDDPIINIIVVFNMPAFFMLSGFLLKDDPGTLGKFLWKKTKRILIPYLFFELLMAGYNTLANGFKLEYLENIVTMRCNIGGDWYLITVFFSFLLVYAVVKLKRKLLELCATGIILLIGFLFRNNLVQIYMSRILIGAFFILLGYLLKPYLERPSLIFGLAGALIVFYVAMKNGYVDICTGDYNNCIWFVLGGAGGFAAVLVLSGFVAENKCLSFFGINTITIVGTNKFIIGKLLQILENRTLLFLCTLLLEIPIILFLNKFVPFLVGQKHKS